MKWLHEALEGASGAGCPKCLVGKVGLCADPMFLCDVCHGTGIPHFMALSQTEKLLEALRDLCDAIPDATIASDPPLGCWVEAARAVLKKAEGK